ncbi:MAG: phosphopyruvate hydratase [Oscillospiraceae bacterium]|nr:phosphopyruvate hydratase [Oscillospiraceae bacterium]
MLDEKISGIRAYEIIDSRGNPTVKAEVHLFGGACGTASVPSGASTGMFEACELRDNDETRFNGKGVLTAVSNVNHIIAPALIKKNVTDQSKIDETMIELDASSNKQNLGANAMLAVSLACARAAAAHYHTSLYRYLGGAFAKITPVPMMNILNGGAHASNNIDIQEFMIMPVGAGSISEAIRTGCEIYHALGSLLKSKKLSAGVGDEGGFAPNLASDEEAIEVILEAISKAGYSVNDVKIALDAASSEWYSNNKYTLPKRKITYSTEELISYWNDLTSKYPIISIEDPLSETDWSGWTSMTRSMGRKIQIVGDDLFVTNEEHLNRGINEKAANAILVKLNQIGTLTETMNTVRTAKQAGFCPIISHRSGETEDSFIADLSVALNAGQIKTGAPCRADRVSKYNRLLRIQSELRCSEIYGINSIKKR